VRRAQQDASSSACCRGWPQQVIIVLIPPLALIFLVLGTIFLGIATPTEGGAMGALGALLMAGARKRLTWTLLKQAMDSTTKLSSFVIFILIGARVFADLLRRQRPPLGRAPADGLPGGETGFLIVGQRSWSSCWPSSSTSSSWPSSSCRCSAPVADKLGIDLIWFGVLLAVNMQTSFMHPPFGFALFYLRSVAPKPTT
jgi:TRAP-type mannitol/chloroaromatic compound transport system permease large subunit